MDEREESLLARVAAPAGSELPPPRALLVFAHSDDEVIAVGGRMERYRDSSFVCVTDGTLPGIGPARGLASDDDWRRNRRKERLAAFRLAGLDSPQAHPAGLEALDGRIVDQQACNYLVQLTRELAAAIEKLRPEAVITHPYEGGHPDHDSCAFAVHTALRLLVRSSQPTIVEAPFYYAVNCSMRFGTFLEEEPGSVTTCALSPAEEQRKQARFACYGSQAQILKDFSTARERFRIAPRYLFTKAPHAGRLHYECRGWLAGDHFRELAAQAMRELGLA